MKTELDAETLTETLKKNPRLLAFFVEDVITLVIACNYSAKTGLRLVKASDYKNIRLDIFNVLGQRLHKIGAEAGVALFARLLREYDKENA